MANCLQCPVRVKDTSGLHGCHHTVPDNAGDSQSGSMNCVLTFLFPSLLLAPQQRQEDRSWLFMPGVTCLPLNSIHHTPLIDTTPDVYTLILSGRFYAFLNRHIKSCRQSCEVFNDEWVRIQIWCILFACSDIGFSFHLELRSWIVLQLVFSSSVHVTFWTQLEFWYLFW